jgi:hypothetical protein
MSLSAFRSYLLDQFELKPPSENLINAMFRRFRPVRIGDNCEGIQVIEDEIDMIDFLLGMNLLSRITQDKKIKCK